MRKNLINSVVCLIALFFTIGVFAGTGAILYMPEELTDGIIENFDITLNIKNNFRELFKNNFSYEIIWVITIWLLGNMRFTTPLSILMIGVRSFFIGFGATFAFLFCEEKWTVILGSILPQATIALTSLTFLSAFCMKTSFERCDMKGSETRHLVTGVVFFVVTAIVSVIEAGCMIFINM